MTVTTEKFENGFENEMRCGSLPQRFYSKTFAMYRVES